MQSIVFRAVNDPVTDTQYNLRCFATTACFVTADVTLLHPPCSPCACSPRSLRTGRSVGVGRQG
jgi:hypothetical protein